MKRYPIDFSVPARSMRRLGRIFPFTTTVLAVAFGVVISSMIVPRLFTPSETTHAQAVTGSYYTQVFNNVTGPTISPTAGFACTGPNTSCSIQNYGMGSHWVKYCITGGTVNSISIELEGSDDQANWMAITVNATTPTGTAGCGVLEGAGYWQWLRVNLITFSGSGSPKLSAWYTGIGSSIPGGGIVAGFKTSQPVNLLSGTNFSTSTLVHTTQTISSSAGVIYEISASNPNGSAVYVNLSGLTGPTTTAQYQVSANGSRDVPLLPGLGFSANATVACSTAINGSGDPATPCIVNINLKNSSVVNSQITSGGTVNGSGNRNPD